MKLQNKTSIYYFAFALPVFIICSTILYFFVSAEIIDNLDESLLKEKTKVEQQLKAGKIVDDLDDEVLLIKTSENGNNSKFMFSDTMMYDKTEEEFLPYRVLKANVNDGKNNFYFEIRKSYIESDDLISSILYPIITLFILLLIGFFFINRFVSKKIWKPFYKTLEQLSNYKIDEMPIKYDVSKIYEFAELNRVLNEMTEKIYTDYINQKQFIENASHEIQTPLAIIKTKIELLIQSSTLSEKDMQIVQSIYNACNKLSSLNKALLLLSKIENNQFKEIETINLNLLIDKTIEHFEDIIVLKNIKIEKEYQTNLIHKINPVLADILISNLIQNAIRHNVESGYIKILITENNVVISNTSNSSIVNTNELFQRFKKNEASAESVGLGLAIVKQICDKYQIKIVYKCENKIHSFFLNL